MNKNQFIQSLQNYLWTLGSPKQLGEWKYIKKGSKYIFQKEKLVYILILGFNINNKTPFLVIYDKEGTKSLFEYKLTDNNYTFDPKREVIFLEDNYRISLFSAEELRQKMRELGWQENPIFEANVNEIDYSNILSQMLDWMEIREKATEKLQLARNLDKKIKVEETISHTEEETPSYQKRLFPLNQILYGPSGTGKTYSTVDKSVAIVDNVFYQQHRNEYSSLKRRYDELMLEGKIAFVTFHQNYSYEDFVQGIRPNTTVQRLKFELKDGIFKRLVKKALADTLQNYVLIIDEINRANISRVFGELITLIEDDKRWGNEHQMTAILPSGEAFCVPKNLYLIGTMNTADKSIALLDIALRRRFVFEFIPPKYENFTDEKGIPFLKSLNKEILEKKGKDFLIGHSEFMKKDFNWESLINHKIIPLLEEYFYTDKKGTTIKKMMEIALLEANLSGKILRDEWNSIYFKSNEGDLF